MGALTPLIRGIGDVREPHIERINHRLHLIPGDLALSGFEAELSEAWGNCLDRREPAFRYTSAFHRVTSMAASKVQADIVITDVDPNFGAASRASSPSPRTRRAAAQTRSRRPCDGVIRGWTDRSSCFHQVTPLPTKSAETFRPIATRSRPSPGPCWRPGRLA